jgi:hypothetical protein
MIKLLILLILNLFSARFVECFAKWFTNDEFCGRELAEGEIIMNEPAIISNERRIIAIKDNMQLMSGDYVDIGDTVQITLSDLNHQYVYEVSPSSMAKFENGGCSGSRIAGTKNAKLVIQGGETQSDKTFISIKAGNIFNYSITEFSFF